MRSGMMVLVFMACAGRSPPQPLPARLGQIAPWPTVSWTVLRPEEVGMDRAKLEEAGRYAFGSGRNTQAVVVVRGGAIVWERYAFGSGRRSWVTTWSTAKSITSALLGIALERGAIADLDRSVAAYLPSWTDTPKEAITVRSLVQMQSGLRFDEEETAGREPGLGQLIEASDVVAYARALEPAALPDTVWNYSSADTVLLGAVLEAATGMPLADYAERTLFQPLGMAPVEWWRDGQGHTHAWCCIDTQARQLAKFGLLFLREGRWDGQVILPAEWVRSSTTERGLYGGYTYGWWVHDPAAPDGLPVDRFSARGFHGQDIHVIPSLDLVVVRNGYYLKAPGDAVAPDGIVEPFAARGGTLGPADWDDVRFLMPIVEAVLGSG